MTAVLRAAKRQINIKVSQEFYEKLEARAEKAGETVAGFAGLLLDAAYSSQAGAPKNATLDAHVALVGLATNGGALRSELAIGTGLSVEVISGWRTLGRASCGSGGSASER